MTTQSLAHRRVGSAIAIVKALTFSCLGIGFTTGTMSGALLLTLASRSAYAAKSDGTQSRSPASSLIEVKDLRYISKSGVVVIETSEPASYNTREVPEQNQVVIEISNASLPAKLKRPYITKEFQQSIASINAYQDRGSTTARVVIQFKDATSAQVQQSGNLLEVIPAGSQASGDDDWSPSSSQAAKSTDYDPRILPTSSYDRSVATADPQFYGKPISIEVRNTPIRDVINLIAEQSGANILLGSDVDGAVSLKLRQVPWDQALLIVMKAQNLGYVREGSVLRIATLQTLQKETEESKKVIDAQKAAEPLKVKVIPVSYADSPQLQAQVASFLSSRGKVTADQRTNSLVVTDIPENLERVANLVKALDTPPLQVLIEGKVVEARETFGRNVGIRWKASGQDYQMGAQTMRTNLSITPGDMPGGASVGIRLGTLDILGDLDAALGLFEREDLAKVVSSPRILTLNNVTANIVQSFNIPISKSTQGTGGTTTSVEFKPIELRLEVTPQITSESDVIMQVSIKREFATNRGEGRTPDINSREAKTKVLVRNGQTSVIGGVFQSDATETEEGVPFLRSIPVLGWLFKNKGVSTEKSELLLFLTPRILNAEKGIPKEDTL